jgi:hypothetical protein
VPHLAALEVLVALVENLLGLAEELLGHQRVVDPLVENLALDYGLVEKPVFLDTLKGPSWTDVMAYAHNAAGEMVVIAVEGKARESFGSPVSEWVLG